MFKRNFSLYEILNPVEYSELIITEGIKIDVRKHKITETFIHPIVKQKYDELGNMAQFVRDNIGFPCVINNWHNKKSYIDLFSSLYKDISNEGIGKAILKEYLETQGDNSFFQNSGTRLMLDCKIGAKLSAHRFGMAVDIKVSVFDKFPTDIRKERYKQAKEYLLTKSDKYNYEKDCTWIHVDFRKNVNHYFSV